MFSIDIMISEYSKNLRSCHHLASGGFYFERQFQMKSSGMTRLDAAQSRDLLRNLQVPFRIAGERSF